MRFTIVGPPRTKKNSLRRLKRGGRVFSVPSESAVAWQAEAIKQLCEQKRAQGARGFNTLGPYVAFPLSGPVSVQALVYRDANRGDLLGYEDAIADALQGGHGKKKVPCVLVDDKQIVSWDGSRSLIDYENPRVELTIEPFSEETTR